MNRRQFIQNTLGALGSIWLKKFMPDTEKPREVLSWHLKPEAIHQWEVLPWKWYGKIPESVKITYKAEID